MLSGGAGDDGLTIVSLDFAQLDGGTGTDTVLLNGAGLFLDLTTIPPLRLIDIERIDVTGSGNNTLRLDALAALNLSGTGNALRVDRDAGDAVAIGSGWTQQADTMINGDTFEVFTQGQALLQVQQTGDVVDATAATVDLSVSSAVSEEGGSLTVTATRSSLDLPLSIPVRLTGTAIRNVDYSVSGATLSSEGVAVVSFASGSATAQFQLNPIDDSLIEQPESVEISLLPGRGFSPGTSTAVTGTIGLPGSVAVTVNGSGDLSLVDASSGAADLITVTLDASSNEFVVTSPDSVLTDGIGSTPATERRIPAASVTGGLNADLGDGDDRLDISAISLSATVTGGAAADELIVIDPTAAEFDGGDGSDQLVLQGAGIQFDLTASASQFTNLERLDISGAGGTNSLTLTVSEVIGLSDSTDTLTVSHSFFDRVDVGSGWTQQVQEIDGRTFEVFTQSTATLQIEAPFEVRLDQLSGPEGFRIEGSSTDSEADTVVGVGDLNGDGLDDIAIIGDRPGDTTPARISIVYGRVAEFPAVDSLANAADVTLDGFSTRPAVAGIGDFNGDGFADLLVGDPTYDEYVCQDAFCSYRHYDGTRGRVWVLFGNDSGFPATVTPSDINGTNGIEIRQSGRYNEFGGQLATIGDVNGDGFDDLGVAGPDFEQFYDSYSDNYFSRAARNHIIYGRSGPFDPVIDILGVNAALESVSISGTGDSAVVGLGDFNGDGFNDVLSFSEGYLDNYYSFANGGESILLFGGPDGIDVEAGHEIRSDSSEGFHSTLFQNASSIGDLNGDGFDDLFISTDYYSTYDLYGRDGRGYVIFGTSGAVPALGDLDGTNGFSLVNRPDGPFSDLGVAFAAETGDLNGDGFDDLQLRSDHQSIALFGHPGPFPATLELDDITRQTGIGLAAGAVGDVNGDGLADVATITAGPTGDEAAGAATIIFGGPFQPGTPLLAGDSNDNLLQATRGPLAADPIAGGSGHDTLVSDGGPDVLNAGAGNDELRIIDTNFMRLDGGRGHDVLRVDAPLAELNLFNVPNNRLRGIDEIDLRGHGATTVYLNEQRVFAVTGLSNDLRLRLDNSDQLFFGGDWTPAGMETVDGDVFDILTQGAGTLRVQQRTDITRQIVTVTASATNVTEDSGESITVTFTRDVTVGELMAWTVFSGSARRDEDYTISGAALLGDDAVVFPAGVDTVQITLTPTADVDLETDETVSVGVSGSREFQVGTPGRVAITIVSDESFRRLSELDGSNGFIIDGLSQNDRLARSVSNAGDVNGDGFDDFVLGTSDYGEVSFRREPGINYVVFGGPGGVSPSLDLSSLDGTTGFRIPGLDSESESGRVVGGGGDVNGDGFDDLVVSSPYANTGDDDAGAVHVIYGRSSAFPPALLPEDLNGFDGFRIKGVNRSDNVGAAIAIAGDVNGDGVDDLIVNEGRFRRFDSSVTYVIFGRRAGFGAALDLTTIDGTNGFRIDSADDVLVVSGARDVNGDGLDDVVVGAPDDDHVYVVFGQTSGFSSILVTDDLDGSNGFRISQPAFGNLFDRAFGVSVSSAGDINNDGLDDVVIGARLDFPDPGKHTLSSAARLDFPPTWTPRC